MAESDSDELMAALGIQAIGKEARLHSETFAQFEFADELRGKFWERIQVMGQSQGWVRVWTDLSSPAWRLLGFDPASPEQAAKIPDAFGHAVQGTWLVLQIRDERAGLPSVDAELQMLRLQNQEENERILNRARIFKTLGYLMVAVFVAWFVWYAAKYFKVGDLLNRR